MAAVSATCARFQILPKQLSFNTSSRIDASKLSLKPVSVGLKRKVFPSLRTSSFRVSCAAKPETVQKVCEIVRKQLVLPSDSEVVPESKLVDLGADSLDSVEIVMALEEEFGITVEEDNSNTIATGQEAADLIEEIVGKKSEARKDK